MPPREEGIVVEQSGALGRPINAFINPALIFISTLMAGASRTTGIKALKCLCRIMHWPSWDTAPWWKLTATETSYIRACLVRDHGAATGRLALYMLKGVLKQAYRLSLIDPDTYQRAVMFAPIKRSTLRAGRMLTEEEIQTLAAAVGKMASPRGPMLEAVFAVGLGGGLRREEVANLKVSDFGSDDVHLLVHGKGAKERLQALPEWAGKTVRKWVTLRNTLSKISVDNPWLFVQVSETQVRNRGLTKHHVWYLINGLMKDLKMDHFTPHDLRRTFASRMIGKTDLVAVSKLMGHTNISMTAHYDRRGIEVAEKAVMGLEAWGFNTSKETPDMKKTIDIPTPPTKGLATIGEALQAKPSLEKVSTGAPRAVGGARLGGAPEEASENVAPEVQKSNVISMIDHPVTGQRLVSRRVVAKPDYLRDGKPLDLDWVRRQCRALVARETLPMKIVEVLTKAGVRRGDGSKVWVDDVTRWSSPS